MTVKKNKQTGKHFKEEILLNEVTGQFQKDSESEFKQPNYSPKIVKSLTIEQVDRLINNMNLHD